MTPWLKDLDGLSSETLAALYGGLHELTGGDIRDAIRLLLWARHSTPGGVWPTHRCDGIRERCAYYKVGECLHCLNAGATPVVKRTLHIRLADREFGGLECSCGRRSDVDYSDTVGHLMYRWRRTEASAFVWPVKRVLVAGRQIPHFVVCRRARTADDVEHGPVFDGACMCGAPFSPSPGEHQLLSSY